MITFSRVTPCALRFTKRPPKIPSLTNFALQKTIFIMKRSVSSQDKPPDPDSPSFQKMRNIINEQSEEQDPVRKEKGICEGLLQHYFSSAAGYRIVVDEHQPEIFHRNTEGTQVQLPDSHIALTRVEKENTVDADRRGKLHALHLYVHADPSETLVARFTDIVRGKNQAGELATPDAAFAILQAGTNIMVFEYKKGQISGKGELRSPGAGL